MAEGLSPDEKLAALERGLLELKTQGDAGDRLAALEQGLSALKQELGGESAGPVGAQPDQVAAPPPLPPPPPPPPAVAAFDPFPSTAIGVEGQRCAVVFYAYDGIPKAEALLETFEDEAADYAASGCALVAVRRVVAGDPADERKAAAYEERFPSINFVGGLESEALAGVRRALQLDDDWVRTLYNEPLVALLDPDGGMRCTLSHAGLRAPQLWAKVTRELHLATPDVDPGRQLTAAEAEANRVALYEENAAWAEVLKEDESLRQPTRSWFDGIGAGRAAERPLLVGVEAAALPEAISRYLEEGEGEEEEEEPLVSQGGVKAPAWYARAKRQAERKQEAERALWNGTAPSATPGPLPLGPKGARLTPMEGYTRGALQEAQAQQKKLMQGFFRYREDEFRSLPGDEAASDGVGAAPSTAGEAGAARSAEGTESALLRAQMLALGLSRSATSTQSTRRVRLLRELEASVRELEAEGFRDRAALAKLKEQIRESYATAPAEFIAEARKADPFNEGLPRLTLSEIATEAADLAGSGIDNFFSALTNLEDGFGKADWNSLDPGRKRGPREKGNKIEISRKPAKGDSE